MIVAQISDLHIKRRGHILNHMPHVSGPLRRTLATIDALERRPDCILATGDLTETGHPAEYAKLRFILEQSGVPVYLMPGNHDRRDALRRVFNDHDYLGAAGPIQYVIEDSSLRVIALDSSETSYRGGYLDELRLEWLRARLAEAPGVATILALHHPPFPTGIAPYDVQGFHGREVLGAIVRAHSQVRRILCGHVHQMLQRPWNGAPGVSAPSTAPTLVLRPHGRGIDFEPGGFLLHHFEGETFGTQLVRTSAAPPLAPEFRGASA